MTTVVHDYSLNILGYTASSRLTWELLGTKLCLKTKETKISYSYNSTAKKLNLFFKWMNALKCYLSRNTHTHSTIPSHGNANQHHNEMPSNAIRTASLIKQTTAKDEEGDDSNTVGENSVQAPQRTGNTTTSIQRIKKTSTLHTHVYCSISHNSQNMEINLSVH